MASTDYFKDVTIVKKTDFGACPVHGGVPRVVKCFIGGEVGRWLGRSSREKERGWPRPAERRLAILRRKGRAKR